MEIAIGWLIAIIAFLFVWNRKITSDKEALEHENITLERSLEITAEMEVANKLAEEQERFELERVETDNWRNKI